MAVPAIPALSASLPWKWIGIGLLVVALSFSLLRTRERLADVKGERDLAEMAHAVTKASLTTLQADMDQIREQQFALANGDANRIAASRQAQEIVEAASKVRQAMIDKLRSSAEEIRPEAQQCEFSEAVLEAWQ